MRIAILGYGKQGVSALEYWGPKNDITICDQNDITVPHGVEKRTGKGYLKDLEHFDLIVRSPAIHPKDIIAANSEHVIRKVTTVTEEFFRVCPAPVIGVTGTKGKGTTSALITKILQTAGKRTHLGGNIGTPPLDLLKEDIRPSDYVVLELANFQLIDLKFSPKIAVCLMVVPEHLDWHSDIKEYITAKQQLFRYQPDDGLAIYNRLSDYSSEVAGVSPALKISYEVPPKNEKPAEQNGAYVLGEAIYYDGEKVCNVSDVKLLGRHNLENVCAAIAATWDIIDNDPSVIVKALADYTGLPHRLELVREKDGIKFYNDSFSATPQAAAAAMGAIPGQKVMICGGFDRGLSMQPIADGIVQKNNLVVHAVLMGQTGQKIAQELQNLGFKDYTVSDAKSLQEIVELARSKAKANQSIVLSPGCASFDMFKNFEFRGNEYKKIVNEL